MSFDITAALMIHILWAITLCQLVNTVVTTEDDLDCMDPNMSAASSSKIYVTIYHQQGIILKTRIFIHTTERPKTSGNGRCFELRFKPIWMQHHKHGQIFQYLPNPTLVCLTYCT
jgi:hypothetical protein